MPRLEYVSESSETEELFESLCQRVREWFKDRFPDFTEPQKMAIPQIMGGHHLLLCSPTGSGKTLTAFLTIIDDLVRKSMNGTLEDGVSCVYISPIKALANDIQKNLIGPLNEIGNHTFQRGLKKSGWALGRETLLRKKGTRSSEVHLIS